VVRVKTYVILAIGLNDLDEMHLVKFRNSQITQELRKMKSEADNHSFTR